MSARLMIEDRMARPAQNAQQIANSTMLRPAASRKPPKPPLAPGAVTSAIATWARELKHATKLLWKFPSLSKAETEINETARHLSRKRLFLSVLRSSVLGASAMPRHRIRFPLDAVRSEIRLSTRTGSGDGLARSEGEGCLLVQLGGRASGERERERAPLASCATRRS